MNGLFGELNISSLSAVLLRAQLPSEYGRAIMMASHSLDQDHVPQAASRDVDRESVTSKKTDLRQIDPMSFVRWQREWLRTKSGLSWIGVDVTGLSVQASLFEDPSNSMSRVGLKRGRRKTNIGRGHDGYGNVGALNAVLLMSTNHPINIEASCHERLLQDGQLWQGLSRRFGLRRNDGLGLKSAVGLGAQGEHYSYSGSTLNSPSDNGKPSHIMRQGHQIACFSDTRIELSATKMSSTETDHSSKSSTSASVERNVPIEMTISSRTLPYILDWVREVRTKANDFQSEARKDVDSALEGTAQGRLVLGLVSSTRAHEVVRMADKNMVNGSEDNRVDHENVSISKREHFLKSGKVNDAMRASPTVPSPPSDDESNKTNARSERDVRSSLRSQHRAGRSSQPTLSSRDLSLTMSFRLTGRRETLYDGSVHAP